MDATKRIDRGIERALAFATAVNRPPKLSEALRYVVLPGGARVRPRLCLAVAMACGDRNPEAADAAAVAIELLHCASLVHDDLPCFDNAAIRRGKPAAHMKFGEELAVLTGDALIVLAFETIARECAVTPAVMAPLIVTIGRAVGMPHGIVAGQGWESEPKIDLEEYHQAKTAALFTGATAAGAIAGGANPDRWMDLGNALGAAYQVADDLHDMKAEDGEMGKPCGQDAVLARPNSVREFGVRGAIACLEKRVEEAVEAIPECRGAETLRALIRNEATRLVPKNLAHTAA